MKPGLRMVAGLARVRRLDAKVRRLVRAAYADEVPGMVLTSLDAYGADELREAFESVAPGATVVGIGDSGTLRYVPRQEIGWLPLRSRGPFS